MIIIHTVNQELEIIRGQSGGVLRPEAVVAYAADPKTALHARFEWDDANAAVAYRLEQARFIIRCTVRMIGDDPTPIRTYVSLRPDRGADSYRDLVEVMRDPNLRLQLLQQSLRELDSWKLRYDRLVELEPVFAAIAHVRKIHKPKPTETERGMARRNREGQSPVRRRKAVPAT